MPVNCDQKFSVLVLHVLSMKLVMYAISFKSFVLASHPPMVSITIFSLYVPGVCLCELSTLWQISYDMFQNAPSGGVSTVRKRSGSTLICRDQHSPITDGITAFPVPTHRTDQKLLSSDCSDSYSLPVEDGRISPVASQPDEGKKPSTMVCISYNDWLTCRSCLSRLFSQLSIRYAKRQFGSLRL